ncbi:MAG: bacterial Ig-like domain-containing protein [Oscillospiraceae bacterium]
MSKVFQMLGGSGGSIKLASIEITTPPTKTAYKAGEQFSTAGMVVKATYSNGATLIATGVSVEPSGGLEAGRTSVTIRYTEGGVSCTATQAVTVTKTNVTVPSQSGSLTYSGSSQSPAWYNYDTAKMTLGGTTSGTNAGTYSAKFTLKDTALYQWADGTTAPKTVSWKIGKADGSLTLSKTTITLEDGKLTDSFTVTRLGTGTISVSSNHPEIATASLSGNVVTVTSVDENSGTVTITVSVASDTNYNAPTNKTCTVSCVFVTIFGVCWTYSNSSTALSRLTPSNDPNGYVNAAVSSEPSAAIGTGAGSSPFDDFMPWQGMEEYNIINGAVSYKKGQSGFSRTSYDTMVFIPEFYYKIVYNSSQSKIYYYVANAPFTGFSKHPGSDRYVGRYNTIASYYSKSGANPLTNITRATARTNSRNKGSKWQQYDYASWCAVWLLYLVEYANWDSQSKIGNGIVGNSSLQKTGTTDSMTYHTGTVASARTGYGGVQYRGIENPWGNVYDWIDGINFNSRAAYICTDPSKYADDTSTNYTSAGLSLPSGGNIKTLGNCTALPWAFIPTGTGGSGTTYVPDYVYSYSGWCVLCVGGSYRLDAAYCGLFFFYGYCNSSDANSSIGARLLYVP